MKADGKLSPVSIAYTGIGGQGSFLTPGTKQNTGNELQTLFRELGTGDNQTSFGSAGRIMTADLNRGRAGVNQATMELQRPG